MSVVDIAVSTGLGPDAVRNDLVYFEKQGVVRRQRGKVELLSTERAYDMLKSSGALRREERRREIVRILKSQRSVSPKSLAQTFNVSETTIRTDLIALEETVAVARQYGVAQIETAVEETAAPVFDEVFTDSARFIGSRVLSLIEPDDQIFLDSSRIAIFTATNLPQNSETGVVTNSLSVASILSARRYSGPVFMLPGIVRTETPSIDVQLTEVLSGRISITKAFFTVAAYSRSGGFAVSNIHDQNLFTFIQQVSERYFLLVPSSGLRARDRFRLPIDRHIESLSEVIVDGVDYSEDSELFPASYPVTNCGDNLILKSPFNKQYVIGFSTLHGKHEYSRIIRNSIENSARAHPNIELMISDNRMDPEVTIQNVDTFIQNEVDLVIEYSQDYQLGPLIAEKLSHAGIPLLAVDIPIPGAVYFGANNYAAGVIAGEAAATEVLRRWTGTTDTLVVFSDSAPGPAVQNRVTGMVEAFCEKVSIDEERIVRVVALNDIDDSRQKLMDTLATSAERVVVFSFNAVATIGILDGLRELEIEDRAIVVSHNYLQRTAHDLSRPDSPLLGTVSFHPERYGERIIDIALKLLTNQAVAPVNYTEHEWIGKSR